MGIIQNVFPIYFRDYKVWYTQKNVEDVTNEQDKEDIIIAIHNPVHRNSIENKAQVLEKYYFPRLHY